MNLRIGMSACFMHADPKRALFKGKTLLYMEQSMGRWLMGEGMLPLMLPDAVEPFEPKDFLAGLDGLLLQGGVDVSPQSYGEEGIENNKWPGDAVRDSYEIALFKEALRMDIPVLGICRGCQVINVALGGTLYQDIQTQNKEAHVHRDWHQYAKLKHEVDFVEGGWLAADYGEGGRINSVHHQGLKDLGADLMVEARSVPDDIIEAVRFRDGAQDGRFVLGVQWHPEFQDDDDHDLISTKPLLMRFKAAMESRRAPSKEK